MTMDCGFNEDALPDHVAGRLEPHRAREVAAHLAGCEDCRRSVELIRAVRASTVRVPEGLESRIQEAVRWAGGVEAGSSDHGTSSRVVDGPAGRRSFGWSSSRSWALALAAAAVLAVLWLGVGREGGLTPWSDPGADVAAEPADYEPYGSWPASDGVVAGELVLSDLSVEELEHLLEGME